MAVPPGAPPAAPPPGAPPAAPPVGAPPAAANTISLPGIGTVTQQPDGSWKAANGLIMVSNGNGGLTPDPTSLALVTSVVKGQSQPGGLPAGSYSVNADGTLTITDPKLAPPGTIIDKNGQYRSPDGTPYSSSTDGSNQPRFATRTPAGAPATANPNFKGDNGGIVTDLVTKDNPIAGTINAGQDLASGQYKKAASDFGAGASGGTLPQVDANGNIVAGDTTAAAASAAGSALSGLGGLGGGSSAIDTNSSDAETARANALADALGGQANTAGAQADADRGLGTQTRAQQEDSIAGLTAAANGTAPSAAELQLKQQSGIDAARQYGLAAALQGNNPAAALRQASIGAATVAGTTNQNAGILRANEQANARTALANALGTVRQGDQSAVTTDVGQQQNLTGAQVTSQGQGVTSTGQKLTAEAAKAQADAQKEGAAIGAAGTLGATLLSDKRAKKDIVKASLADALGKGVHGVTFEYRPESGEDDTPHFGLLADQLERVVPGVVKRGPSGFKEVDTGHLTLGNTAIIAELAARLMDLEKKQGARR